MNTRITGIVAENRAGRRQATLVSQISVPVRLIQIRPNFHPVRSYSGLQAYLFFWIFVKYLGLIWKNFGKN